jgi:methionyl-tRNA formyltransferase
MKIALLALTKNRFTNGIQNTLEVYGNEVERIETNPTAEYLGHFDLAVSWFWPHILTPEQIAAPKHGALNSHIGLLPAGRGACPNVWSIVWNEPSGVTIHWINTGVDTGPIIFQRDVDRFATDTGETLYDRLCVSMAELFKEKWYYIQLSLRDDSPVLIETKVQTGDHRTYRMRDLGPIDDLEARFGRGDARHFVDIIRARTFAGHESAYIRDDQGRKVYVRVSLSYE